MPRSAGEGACACTPTTLNELFLPDVFIDKVVSATNAYASAQLPPLKVEPVARVDILQFFALYYYFGLVRLPSKEDYWKADYSIWPIHPACQCMTKNCFLYIWRYIHLTDLSLLCISTCKSHKRR